MSFAEPQQSRGTRGAIASIASLLVVGVTLAAAVLAGEQLRPLPYAEVTVPVVAWAIGASLPTWVRWYFNWLSEQALALSNRGQVQLVDVMMSFFVLVAILATAPIWTEFVALVGSEADGFSGLLLELGLPLLILSLIVSVGVSARRGGG
jgi:divalent metal cation (Fe/Co/Zn/Cd) transporter